MGKASRARWDGNVKSMEIIAKPRDQVTAEDIDFLRENYTSTGGLLPNAYAGGAFYTPTHVAKFVWQALESKLPLKPRVLEPSVGSGIFLEHAPADAEITALELDSTSVKVTSLLYPQAEVIEGDALTHNRRDYYDLVIGNPPYGVTCEFEQEEGEVWVSGSTAKGKRKGKSEVLFIELAIKAAKPGGYIAFVLPKGLAFANYAEKLRKYMHANCWQVATVFLPGETFVHTGTTIETQIMVVRKAPANTPLIDAVQQKWGSNFHRSDYGDITEFGAKFLPGQPPAYFAKITNIGWDKKGVMRPNEDGLTQLDELLEDFKDDNLMRENLYPHLPSWHGVDKGNEAFFFSHGNETCDGYRDGSRTFANGPYRWNELTLGAGKEFTYEGVEYSSWVDDMETLQDRLIKESEESSNE